MFNLPTDLARRHSAIREAFAVIQELSNETGEPLENEELAREVVDFLMLTVEHIASHIENYKAEEWQTFLIDFVYEFVYMDENGSVQNFLSLPEGDLDAAVADACALDEDDERTPAQRLTALREEVIETRARFDDMTLG